VLEEGAQGSDGVDAGVLGAERGEDVGVELLEGVEVRMRAPALVQLPTSDSQNPRPKSSGSVVRTKLEMSPRLISGTPGIQSMIVLSR